MSRKRRNVTAMRWTRYYEKTGYGFVHVWKHSTQKWSRSY